MACALSRISIRDPRPGMSSLPGAIYANYEPWCCCRRGEFFWLVIGRAQSCNSTGMKIRKIAALTALVLSSFAATNVAPSKSELEAMYSKAFRDFDANNFPEALKQLDEID